jgi:hypothetical protein
MRTWTDNTGKYHVVAVLVGASDGAIRIAKENGRILTVAINRLSDADRQFVQGRQLVANR